jgi:hypothetical protein
MGKRSTGRRSIRAMEAKTAASPVYGTIDFYQLLSKSDEEIMQHYSFKDGERKLKREEALRFLAFLRKELGMTV